MLRASLLALVAFSALAAASHPVPPVELSGLRFSHAVVPGAGASAYELHTLVEFDTTNPTDVDYADVRATLYAGIGVSVEKGIVLPSVPAGSALHWSLDVNTVPSPYYCITLGHKPATPPADGFQAGTCALVDGFAAPLP